MKETSDFSIAKHICEHYDELKTSLDKIHNLDEFSSNTERRKAILFDFFQIGELLNQLSRSFKIAFNNKYLVSIVAIRNRIVHGYETIKDEVIYSTLKNDIPSFVKELDLFSKRYYQLYLKELIGQTVWVRRFQEKPVEYKGELFYVGELKDVRTADSNLQIAYIKEEIPIDTFQKGIVTSIINIRQDKYIVFVNVFNNRF